MGSRVGGWGRLEKVDSRLFLFLATLFSMAHLCLGQGVGYFRASLLLSEPQQVSLSRYSFFLDSDLVHGDKELHTKMLFLGCLPICPSVLLAEVFLLPESTLHSPEPNVSYFSSGLSANIDIAHSDLHVIVLKWYRVSLNSHPCTQVYTHMFTC